MLAAQRRIREEQLYHKEAGEWGQQKATKQFGEGVAGVIYLLFPAEYLLQFERELKCAEKYLSVLSVLPVEKRLLLLFCPRILE